MISRNELIRILEEKGYLEDQLNLFYIAKLIRIKISKSHESGKYDFVVAFTGTAGSGKSTLAIMLGILVDKKYNISKNIVYIPKSNEVKKKFDLIDDGSVFHVDEAIKSLYKLKWYEKEQQSITETYATERYKRICSFFLMPRFQDFTEGFRNYRINLWIWIVDRGTAIIYMRDNDKDIKDPWHTDENIKIKNEYFKRRSVMYKSTEAILQAERKTPNYICDFKFPDYAEIDPDGYKLYEQMKLESRKVDDNVDEEKLSLREQKYKMGLIKLIKWIREKLKVSYANLGEIIGVSEQAISTMMAQDLQSTKNSERSYLIYNTNKKERTKTI